MPIPPDLLTILACPSADHAPLELTGDELVCTSCASRFPIRDGIPVLLADEAVPGPNGLGVPALDAGSSGAGASNADKPGDDEPSAGVVEAGSGGPGLAAEGPVG